MSTEVMAFHQFDARMRGGGWEAVCACGWKHGRMVPTVTAAYGAFKEHAAGEWVP